MMELIEVGIFQITQNILIKLNQVIYTTKLKNSQKLTTTMNI